MRKSLEIQQPEHFLQKSTVQYFCVVFIHKNTSICIYICVQLWIRLHAQYEYEKYPNFFVRFVLHYVVFFMYFLLKIKQRKNL